MNAPIRKPWPARETQKIAAESIEAAAHGDMSMARRMSINLLREHQKHMVPHSEAWLRAEATIANLRGQL